MFCPWPEEEGPGGQLQLPAEVDQQRQVASQAEAAAVGTQEGAAADFTVVATQEFLEGGGSRDGPGQPMPVALQFRRLPGLKPGGNDNVFGQGGADVESAAAGATEKTPART